MNVFYRYLAAVVKVKRSVTESARKYLWKTSYRPDKIQKNGPEQKEASAFLWKMRFSKLKKSLEPKPVI